MKTQRLKNGKKQKMKQNISHTKKWRNGKDKIEKIRIRKIATTEILNIMGQKIQKNNFFLLFFLSPISYLFLFPSSLLLSFYFLWQSSREILLLTFGNVPRLFSSLLFLSHYHLILSNLISASPSLSLCFLLILFNSIQLNSIKLNFLLYIILFLSHPQNYIKSSYILIHIFSPISFLSFSF